MSAESSSLESILPVYLVLDPTGRKHPESMNAFDVAIEVIENAFKGSCYSDAVQISLIICGKKPEYRQFTPLKDFKRPNLAEIQEDPDNYQNFLSQGLDQLKRRLEENDTISVYKPILILFTNQADEKSVLRVGLLPCLYLMAGGVMAELHLIVGHENKGWCQGTIRDVFEENVYFAGDIGEAEDPETWLAPKKK